MGRVTSNPQAVKEAFARDIAPDWQRDVGSAGVAAIEAASPVDRGRLAASWTYTEFTDNQGRPAVRYRSTAFYAPYVDKGTGVHGPHRQRIYPVRAKYLSWIDRASGDRVYRASVAGQPGQRYVAKGLRTVFGRDSVVDHQWA